MTRDERLRQQWRIFQHYHDAGDHERKRALIGEMAQQAKTPADLAVITVLQQQCELDAQFTRLLARCRALIGDKSQR